MKVILGQINTTPRDFEENYEKIIQGIDKASKNECDLIVFPEMAICGYLSADLLFTNNYIETNLDYLNKIASYSKIAKDLHIVVGYVDYNRKGYGKPFKNMAAVIQNGKIIGTYQKQLLPFYDVFDEGRYFEPGNENLVIKIGNEKWGIIICEDGWNDKMGDDEYYNYETNPVKQYINIGVNNIISINSSPYVEGKPEDRIKAIARNEKIENLIYVNQVGGQDELIFDGNSFIYSHGFVYKTNKPFHSNYHLYFIFNDFAMIFHSDYDACYKVCHIYRDNALTFLKEALVVSLRDYIYKSGFKEVVIGSSGGIDSAVTIALACEAIGPENVHAITIPSIYSSQSSMRDAEELHKNLGCHSYTARIEHKNIINYLNDMYGDVENYNQVADENIQARLRAVYLMHFSNSRGALLITTGNKSELAIGYCTLYGDCCGGFAPISDVLKMDVYALAKEINKQNGQKIPQNIIEKEPSAELAENQKDSDELPSYPILDKIVKDYVENYICDYDIFKEHNKSAIVDKETYDGIIRRIDANEFKRRQAPIGTKISKVAFGSGRRVPIVKK